MEGYVHDNRIYTFYQVAKLRSFSEAAKNLFITQPAVSFQIRQLEEYYGIKLFDTRKRQVVLTQAGAILFDYAEKLVKQYQEMDRIMNEFIGKTAQCLYLGSSTTPGEYILPKILADFQKDYSNQNVFLTIANTEKIYQLITEEHIDLAIVGREISAENVICEIFLPDELVIIAATSLPIVSNINPDIQLFSNIPLILREDGSATRIESLKALNNAGMKEETMAASITLNSNEAIKRAVETGMGVSILSRWAVLREIELGLLEVIPIPSITFDRKFFFLFKERNYKKEVIWQFIKFAKNYDLQMGFAHKEPNLASTPLP